MAGNNTLTKAQEAGVRECIMALRIAGVHFVTAHWNRCGCCISVHEDMPADHITNGYVVNRHGDVSNEYVQ